MNRVRTVLALFDLLKKCMILIPVWSQKPTSSLIYLTVLLAYKTTLYSKDTEIGVDIINKTLLTSLKLC